MVKNPQKVATMNVVWKRLMDYATDNKQNEKFIAEEFNTMLDRLLGDDFFGRQVQTYWTPTSNWPVYLKNSQGISIKL